MSKKRCISPTSDRDVAAASSPPLELRYFPLLAKGLGPALVLEHSGLPWHGNRDLPFTIHEHWAALKPTTPFGQLPLLSAPTIGLQLAQTTAIINYVGRKAGIEGDTDDRYTISQMLIAEAEDIYAMMNKFLPTVYKRLSSDKVITSKGTRDDYDHFWSTLLPAQMEKLERLWGGPASDIVLPPAFMNGEGLHPGFSPGELYLWSMLYQLTLVDEMATWPREITKKSATGIRWTRLQVWYRMVEAHRSTAAVIKGHSSMGELRQYYQHADSSDVCSEGDERGRWG